MNNLIITINTKPEFFSSWLISQARPSGRTFPTEKGYFCLQNGKLAKYSKISIDADWVTIPQDSDQTYAYPIRDVITFEWQAIRENELQVTCSSDDAPSIKGYFLELLHTIANTYPEAKTEIKKYVDAEHENDRQKDLDEGNYWTIETVSKFDWIDSINDVNNHLMNLAERDEAKIYPLVQVKVGENKLEGQEVVFTLFGILFKSDSEIRFGEVICHLGTSTNASEVEIKSFLPLSFSKYEWVKHFLEYVNNWLNPNSFRNKETVTRKTESERMFLVGFNPLEFAQMDFVSFTGEGRMEINLPFQLIKLGLESHLDPLIRIKKATDNNDVARFELYFEDSLVSDLTLTRTPAGKSLLMITPDLPFDPEKMAKYPGWYPTMTAEENPRKIRIVMFITGAIQWAWEHHDWEMNPIDKITQKEKTARMDARPREIGAIANTPLILNEKNEKALEPWEQIDDHLWDRKALEMWWEGYENSDIAKKVGVTPRAVTNSISFLRSKYGEEIVPKNASRKKYLIKTHDTG